MKHLSLAGVSYVILFSYLVFFIHITSCNPSAPDSSIEVEKPHTKVDKPMIGSNMTRISFQDLNKSLGPDGKRQIHAIPLLPYPDDLEKSTVYD